MSVNFIFYMHLNKSFKPYMILINVYERMISDRLIAIH